MHTHVSKCKNDKINSGSSLPLLVQVYLARIPCSRRKELNIVSPIVHTKLQRT
jgi:hypothetical protein